MEEKQRALSELVAAHGVRAIAEQLLETPGFWESPREHFIALGDALPGDAEENWTQLFIFAFVARYFGEGQAGAGICTNRDLVPCVPSPPTD